MSYGHINRNKCGPAPLLPRAGIIGCRYGAILGRRRIRQESCRELAQHRQDRRKTFGENHEEVMMFTVGSGSKGANRAPGAATEVR